MLGNYRQVAHGSQRAGCRYAKIRLRVNIFDWKCNGEMTSGDFIPKALEKFFDDARSGWDPREITDKDNAKTRPANPGRGTLRD
jgi:hypothetical protein